MSISVETDYAKIDWQSLAGEVTHKLQMLSVAWAASQRDMHPNVHKKMVEDLYLPAIRLLAEFCASIEESDEDEDEE